MKIVFIVDWHSEKMGYSDNFMPASLARLGHEVHLITTNHQVYFNSVNKGFYKETLESFLGPGVVPVGYSFTNGVHVHRLKGIEFRKKLYPFGLIKLLRKLRPDVVQSGEFISWQTYVSAALKPFLKFCLFIECHTHASVFPPARGKSSFRERIFWNLFSKTTGKYLNNVIAKSFPISTDAAEIVEKFYGIDIGKIEVRSLGVDTHLFVPANTDHLQKERLVTRNKFGYNTGDVVCIYTGRITREKNPLLLAQAVEILIGEGLPYRSFFLGSGPKDYSLIIQNTIGAHLVDYVTTLEIPKYYQMSDIAVWPAQESTSQLDALGCGLPLVLGSKVKVIERVERNGLLYKEGDASSLADALRTLQDPKVRKEMGELSRHKAEEIFSWDSIGRKYERDYSLAYEQLSSN